VSSGHATAPTYQRLRGGVVDLAVVVEAVADLPLDTVSIDAATGAVTVTAPNPGVGRRVAHRLQLADAAPSATGQSITWTSPTSAVRVTASTLVDASPTGRTYGSAASQRTGAAAIPAPARGRRRGWAEAGLASVPTTGGRS
jgi:hypothetical protein